MRPELQRFIQILERIDVVVHLVVSDAAGPVIPGLVAVLECLGVMLNRLLVFVAAAVIEGSDVVCKSEQRVEPGILIYVLSRVIDEGVNLFVRSAPSWHEPVEAGLSHHVGPRIGFECPLQGLLAHFTMARGFRKADDFRIASDESGIAIQRLLQIGKAASVKLPHARELLVRRVPRIGGPAAGPADVDVIHASRRQRGE